jgi:hypothetical protein
MPLLTQAEMRGLRDRIRKRIGRGDGALSQAQRGIQAENGS